jgi:hypothetical protein
MRAHPGRFRRPYNGGMARVRAALLVGGALVWLVAGAAEVVWRTATAPRSPAWAPALAPLAAAPVASGTAVALQTPAGLHPAEVTPLLLEAAWQRPDLHWELAGTLPQSVPPDALVTVGEALPPPGWHEAWHDGALALYRRTPP